MVKSEGSCDICMLTQNTAPTTAPSLADHFCSAKRVDPISVFSSAGSTRLRKCRRVAMHVSAYFGVSFLKGRSRDGAGFGA